MKMMKRKRHGTAWVKKLFLISGLLMCITCLLPGSASAGSTFENPIYNVESSSLIIRTGYHFFSESDSWLDSKSRTLEEDFFFRDETTYVSTNVNTNLSNSRTGAPMLTLEWLFSFDMYDLEVLNNRIRHNIKGLYFAPYITFYPFSSLEETHYSGPMTYTNADTGDVHTYNGSITEEEQIFFFTSGVNFYMFKKHGYYANRIHPYGSLELGLSFMSGERKMELSSSPLQVSPTEVRQIRGTVQEQFFNALSPRLGISVGTKIQLKGFHAIDVRLGFIYQETSVSMDRFGTWRESINDTVISRKVDDLSGKATFSQTGVYFNIGYVLDI